MIVVGDFLLQELEVRICLPHMLAREVCCLLGIRSRTVEAHPALALLLLLLA